MSREWFPCPKRRQFDKICWEVCHHNQCPNLRIDIKTGYSCKFKSKAQKRVEKKVGSRQKAVDSKRRTKQKYEEEIYSAPV